MSLSQNCNKLSVSAADNNDLHQERADVAFTSCMTSLRFQYYKKNGFGEEFKKISVATNVQVIPALVPFQPWISETTITQKPKEA